MDQCARGQTAARQRRGASRQPAAQPQRQSAQARTSARIRLPCRSHGEPAMNAEPSDYFHDSPDGLRLYCRIYPAQRAGGLPALCLPGLTRNGRDFGALAAHLRCAREVMTPDLRGRGRSAWDPEPSHYQLPTYVQDAWSLLDARGVGRVLVIGTSLGALMGMAMAAMKPDRIAGVVLNDAGPEIDPAGIRRIAGYAGKLAAGVLLGRGGRAGQERLRPGIARSHRRAVARLCAPRLPRECRRRAGPRRGSEDQRGVQESGAPLRATCGRCMRRSKESRCW